MHGKSLRRHCTARRVRAFIRRGSQGTRLTGSVAHSSCSALLPPPKRARDLETVERNCCSLALVAQRAQAPHTAGDVNTGLVSPLHLSLGHSVNKRCVQHAHPELTHANKRQRAQDIVAQARFADGRVPALPAAIQTRSLQRDTMSLHGGSSHAPSERRALEASISRLLS